MALLQRLRAPLGRLATQSRVFAAAYHEKVIGDAKPWMIDTYVWIMRTLPIQTNAACA